MQHMVSVTFPFDMEKNLEHQQFVHETLALIGGKEEFAEVCFIEEPMREIGYEIPVRLNDEEVQSLTVALLSVFRKVEINQWTRDDEDDA